MESACTNLPEVPPAHFDYEYYLEVSISVRLVQGCDDGGGGGGWVWGGGPAGAGGFFGNGQLSRKALQKRGRPDEDEEQGGGTGGGVQREACSGGGGGGIGRAAVHVCGHGGHAAVGGVSHSCAGDCGVLGDHLEPG